MQSIPVDLIIELNNQCNLRCQHCKIWEERPLHFLDLNQLKDIITQSKNAYARINNISLTGGEIFMNPNIEKILLFLCKLQQQNIIDHFDFVSNGFLEPKIKKIFLDNKEIFNNTKFNIAFSIDGMQEAHNLQRGNPKSFQQLQKTLAFFKEEFPKNKPTLKFTATQLNYKDVIPLFNWCKENKYEFAPKIAEFQLGNYYHRNGDPAIPKHSKEMLEQFYKDLETIKSEGEGIADSKPIELTQEFMKTKQFSKHPCYTPLRSLFIDCKGNVFPCLYYDPITNINKEGWQEELFTHAHKELIALGLKKDCKGCLAYHGFMKPYNISK